MAVKDLDEDAGLRKAQHQLLQHVQQVPVASVTAIAGADRSHAPRVAQELYGFIRLMDYEKAGAAFGKVFVKFWGGFW